jgi:hypothetical protein
LKLRGKSQKIVSGKWSPIVYTDDFVSGRKVAKNWPSWTFDADAWKQFVIGIQDKAEGSRGLLSPGENFCDDISSSDCIDMDDGSIEDNEEKKNTKQEVQNTEENEEYDDDDDNYFDNKAEYGTGNHNSSKDDNDTCDNEHDEENEEYDDDDDNYFKNEAEYGLSDRISSKDD